MKRDEFLKGIIFICAGSCLAACTSGDSGGDGGNTPPPLPSGSTVSVDLSSLTNVGNQVKKNNILFFRIATGSVSSSFVATEAICPHESGRLVWMQNQGLIECELHSAQFEANGTVIRGPQNSNGSVRTLKINPITVSGTQVTATVA